MLSEKIKNLRKQAKLSQEQLAEKVGVSWQAVTKWETNMGVPDIQNLCAISKLFGISLDELMENTRIVSTKTEFLYESATEYDMETEKHYDIAFFGAKEISVAEYPGEKIKIRLASNTISDIQSAFKVKIDDIKKRIDIDIKHYGNQTEAKAKEGLYIFIMMPQEYTKNIELTGNAQTLKLERMQIDNIEFSGKVSLVMISDVKGHIELNSNMDLLVDCDSINGQIDINQISSTSRIKIPAGSCFAESLRGIGNHIYYEHNNMPCENFSLQGDAAKVCENIIELNGMKSELVIFTDHTEADNI